MELWRDLSQSAGNAANLGGSLMLRAFGPLLVCVKLMLQGVVAYEYFSDAVYRLTPVYGDWGVVGMTSVALMFTLAEVFNFVACICVSPGYAPVTQDFPQCDKCGRSKPPRAHHCLICKACILKLDHHCPWVNNCIGAPNLAYFLLLLIVTLCDIGGIGGTAAYALASNQAKTEVCLVANWGIMTSMVPVFMAVGVLLTIQSKNFAINQTTFERFSKRKKTENAVNTPQSCLSNCAIMCSRSESPLQQPLLIHDL